MRTSSSTVNKLTLRRYGIHEHTGAIKQARHSGLMNDTGRICTSTEIYSRGGYDNHDKDKPIGSSFAALRWYAFVCL